MRRGLARRCMATRCSCGPTRAAATTRTPAPLADRPALLRHRDGRRSAGRFQRVVQHLCHRGAASHPRRWPTHRRAVGRRLWFVFPNPVYGKALKGNPRRHLPRRPAVAPDRRVTMAWTRDEMAARAAKELKDGFYVNLGIGIRHWWPTISRKALRSRCNPKTGCWASGRFPMTTSRSRPHQRGQADISELPHSVYFSSADSFAMIRGRAYRPDRAGRDGGLGRRRHRQLDDPGKMIKAWAARWISSQASRRSSSSWSITPRTAARSSFLNARCR